MSATRLPDLVLDNEILLDYIVEESTRKSALWGSGIFQSNTTLSSFLAGDGENVAIPFWNQLDTAEANISTDNAADVATPAGITTGKQIATRHNRNGAWQSADLNAMINKQDPMLAIGNLIAEYWGAQYDQFAINSMAGVEADNVANDNSDMVVNVANDAAGPIAAAELFTVSNFIDAKATMGDMSSDLAAVVVHSAVYHNLLKAEEIDFIPDSETAGEIPTYMGTRVIVSDSCPAVSGAERITYTSYLYAPGAIYFGSAPAKNPMAFQREELQGNGGGVETLVSRQQFAIHPQGFAWTGASVASVSPSNAELANALNWNRVFVRKNVKIAILKTNG